MKKRKLVIEIDDSAIDSVIEKVRLLKDELSSLGLPVNWQAQRQRHFSQKTKGTRKTSGAGISAS